MHVRPLLFATTLLLVSALAWPAHAEVDPDDLGFDLVAAARYRKEKPLIVMTPSINVKKLQFKLVRSDGKKLTLRTGAIRADRTRKIAIPQGKGIYTYSCAITGKAGREKFGPFKMNFEIKVGEPPLIALSPMDVSEATRTIKVRVTEPAGRIDLKVWGDDGEIIDEVEVPYKQAPKTPITVTWKQTAKQVMGRFELKAWDVVGFWSGIESVTFLNIPHDDIVFESGKHNIRPEEEKKLIEPLSRIRNELQKVKGVLPITLYVGGYTDTVGSAADNIGLSLRRARSIAKWFRKHGIKVPIKYQGFGESVLFAATPDNTPAAANRRASYVLSAALPPVTRGFPTRNWKSVR